MSSKARADKIHLGCGDIAIPGFLNIDIQPGPAVDLVADLQNLPLEPECASLIYASSVLEHFGRREWAGLLASWVDFLAPNGTMRLSVPDFGAIISQYESNGNLEELLGLLIGGQKDDYDWHGMIFDFDTLKAGMEQAGLSDITPYDWRQTDVGILQIDDFSQAYLPHMDKEKGRLMMLNVEGVKKRPKNLKEHD